jgi:hypothetical protein
MSNVGDCFILKVSNFDHTLQICGQSQCNAGEAEAATTNGRRVSATATTALND